MYNVITKSMADTKKIKTALVSVFHKDGLDELLKKLNEEGVKFLSTGGTQKWWDMMADIMEVNPDNSPVTVPIQEVFHLD